MKSITKYHEFKRRDGSIISKIKKADGTITADPDEVNKLTLEHLKSVQISENEPLYTSHTPFPTLESFNRNEMDYILSKLFSGKVIAFDAVSEQTNNSNETQQYLER